MYFPIRLEDVVVASAIHEPVKVGYWESMKYDWTLTDDMRHWQREGTIHICLPFSKIFNIFLNSMNPFIRELRNHNPYLVPFGTFNVIEKVVATTEFECQRTDNCVCKNMRMQVFIMPENDVIKYPTVKSTPLGAPFMEGFKCRPCRICGKVAELSQLLFEHANLLKREVPSRDIVIPGGAICTKCKEFRMWTIDELRQIPISSIIEHSDMGIGVITGGNSHGVEFFKPFENGQKAWGMYNSYARPWNATIRRLS